MKTIDFYYAAQKANSMKDADMARALEITSSAIAQAKKREHLSAYHAARCAEMAGLDPEEAMKAAAIEAEHEPEKRNYLLRILTKGYNARRADVAQSVEQLIRNQ